MIAHIHIGKAVGGNGEAKSRIFACRLIGNYDRGYGSVVGVGDSDIEILRCGCAGGIGGGYADCNVAYVFIDGGSGESSGRGIKDQPCRKRTAISQGSREAQMIAHIHIREAVGGNSEAEGRVFTCGLISNDDRGYGRIIGVGDSDVEVLDGGCTGGVGGGDPHGKIAHIIIGRGSGESSGCRIKDQPCGQWTAVGKRGRQSEMVTCVNIHEAVGGNGETKARILGCGLIGDGHGRDRSMIGFWMIARSR